MNEIEAINIIQAAYSTPEGKNLIDLLISKSGCVTMSFVPNDPYTTAFNEGKKVIGRELLAAVAADPNQIVEILNRGEYQ